MLLLTYVVGMRPTSVPILILAVTEHSTRIWDLLADSHAMPKVVDCPPGSSKNDHVIADRHHRAHGAYQFADEYFQLIWDALPYSAELIVVGHGRGQGNMARGFIKFLHERRAQRDLHVHSLITANIPAMTDAQIVAKARRTLEPLTA
jgi:hypothetical protein